MASEAYCGGLSITLLFKFTEIESVTNIQKYLFRASELEQVLTLEGFGLGGFVIEGLCLYSRAATHGTDVIQCVGRTPEMAGCTYLAAWENHLPIKGIDLYCSKINNQPSGQFLHTNHWPCASTLGYQMRMSYMNNRKTGSWSNMGPGRKEVDVTAQGRNRGKVWI